MDFLAVALHCAQKFCVFHKCHRLCVQDFVCPLSVYLTHLAKKKPCNKNVVNDGGAEPSSESEKISFQMGSTKSALTDLQIQDPGMELNRQ